LIAVVCGKVILRILEELKELKVLKVLKVIQDHKVQQGLKETMVHKEL
jgi:hypothetical protein